MNCPSAVPTWRHFCPLWRLLILQAYGFMAFFKEMCKQLANLCNNGFQAGQALSFDWQNVYQTVGRRFYITTMTPAQFINN